MSLLALAALCTLGMGIVQRRRLWLGRGRLLCKPLVDALGWRCRAASRGDGGGGGGGGSRRSIVVEERVGADFDRRGRLRTIKEPR